MSSSDGHGGERLGLASAGAELGGEQRAAWMVLGAAHALGGDRRPAREWMPPPLVRCMSAGEMRSAVGL